MKRILGNKAKNRVLKRFFGGEVDAHGRQNASRFYAAIVYAAILYGWGCMLLYAQGVGRVRRCVLSVRGPLEKRWGTCQGALGEEKNCLGEGGKASLNGCAWTIKKAKINQ